MSHTHETRGVNRRKYPRFPFYVPLVFKVCQRGLLDQNLEGASLNVSQNGILFSSINVPPLSSVVLLETDLSVLERCINVEGTLLTMGQYVVAKVVRVIHHKENGYSTVALHFIKQCEKIREDVHDAISLVAFL